MPSIEELKALVKEFKEEGVSEEEIRKTLQEMNVDTSTISALLGEAETPPKEEKKEEEGEVKIPEPEEVPVPPLPREPPEEETDKEIEQLPHLETAEHVKEIHRKVEELHTAVAKTDDIVEVKERLAIIEEDVKELKGMLKAIQKLLQEILNTNRSILVDLYEEAKKKP